jgi:hypothetical protein
MDWRGNKLGKLDNQILFYDLIGNESIIAGFINTVFDCKVKKPKAILTRALTF